MCQTEYANGEKDDIKRAKLAKIADLQRVEEEEQ